MMLLVALLGLYLFTEGLATTEVDADQRFTQTCVDYEKLFITSLKRHDKPPTVAQVLNVHDQGTTFHSVLKMPVASGNVKEKMAQEYKNLPVYDSHLVVEEEKETGKFISFYGQFYEGIEQDVPDVKPKIDAKEAIKIAKQKAEEKDKDLEAESSLHIYIKDGKAHLSYHIEYSKPTEMKTMIFEIDAKTGELLDMYNGFVTGGGEGVAGGGEGEAGGIVG